MVIAFWTDLVIAVNLLAIDDFPAVVALQPQALDDLGPFRRLGNGHPVFFEPGHLLSQSVWLMACGVWPERSGHQLSAISSLLDRDLLSFFQHRQFRNPESGQLTSDLFTDPRFEMVHIDRKVRPADLAKLASEDGRRQVFAGTSQLRHGIRE